MTATKTRSSGLKPPVFVRISALGLMVILAIALTLALIAMATSKHDSAFADSQAASQSNTLQGNMDVQDVAPDRSGENPSPTVGQSSRGNPVAAGETNQMAIWLTTMAVGLSSDSSVTYLAYISTLSHARDASITASSTTLK